MKTHIKEKYTEEKEFKICHFYNSGNFKRQEKVALVLENALFFLFLPFQYLKTIKPFVPYSYDTVQCNKDEYNHLCKKYCLILVNFSLLSRVPSAMTFCASIQIFLRS